VVVVEGDEWEVEVEEEAEEVSPITVEVKVTRLTITWDEFKEAAGRTIYRDACIPIFNAMVASAGENAEAYLRVLLRYFLDELGIEVK